MLKSTSCHFCFIHFFCPLNLHAFRNTGAYEKNLVHFLKEEYGYEPKLEVALPPGINWYIQLSPPCRNKLQRCTWSNVYPVSLCVLSVTAPHPWEWPDIKLKWFISLTPQYNGMHFSIFTICREQTNIPGLYTSG